MVKIEAGKYYRDGFGEKIGPMEKNPNPSVYCWIGKTPKGGTVSFAENGKWTTIYPSPYNLVAEWQEVDPTRAITHKGEYWDRLFDDTVIQYDDKRRDKDGTVAFTSCKGKTAKDAMNTWSFVEGYYRKRPIPAPQPAQIDSPGEGYRWVLPGEIVDKDDEYQSKPDNWYKTGDAGRKQLDMDIKRRRRITVESAPKVDLQGYEMEQLRKANAELLANIKQRDYEFRGLEKQCAEQWARADKLAAELAAAKAQLKEQEPPRWKVYKTNYEYTLNIDNRVTRPAGCIDIGKVVFVYDYPGNMHIKAKLIDVQYGHQFPYITEGGHRFKHAAV